jgi:deoxyribonuclease-4
VHRAFDRARALEAESLQLFVKNPNGWRGKVLDESAACAFKEAQAASGCLPVVAHAGYLINLCARDPETLRKSKEALADELLRCTALGISALVVHPGAHLGAGEEAGLTQIARSIDEIFATHPQVTATLLLENTAGQGTVLGYRFAQLRAILERVDQPERLGVCLDTCHAFAAGYDLTTAEGYEAALDEFDATVGFEKLRGWHLNDSLQPLGTRKDRHANLGQGTMGLEAFARLLADPRMAGLPTILETPLGDDGQGHARDLAVLRELRRSGVA